MSTAPSLHSLQADFAAWILGREDARLAAWVADNGLAPEARLQIYRNIVFNNLTAALRTDFPVVLKLVGEEFFLGAAARYIRTHPSRSGNLQDYGAAFPGFLAAMPEAAGVPYLADVARLEWARQEAYLAAEAMPASITDFALIAEDERTALRFDLHPSARLVSSRYPVLDIWMFCQQESPEHLRLSDEAQAVMVWREGVQVAMQVVSAECGRFVASLLAGQLLAAAYQSAVEASPNGFDLTACLHWLFRTGLITGYSTLT